MYANDHILRKIGRNRIDRNGCHNVEYAKRPSQVLYSVLPNSLHVSAKSTLHKSICMLASQESQTTVSSSLAIVLHSPIGELQQPGSSHKHAGDDIDKSDQQRDEPTTLFVDNQ